MVLSELFFFFFFRFSVFVSESSGQILCKKNLRPPSYSQEGRHPFLKLLCALSPDCFDRLSSNFVQSLILLMAISPVILSKID